MPIFGTIILLTVISEYGFKSVRSQVIASLLNPVICTVQYSYYIRMKTLRT